MVTKGGFCNHIFHIMLKDVFFKQALQVIKRHKRDDFWVNLKMIFLFP